MPIRSINLVVIGGSAGAFEVLNVVLPSLTQRLFAPVVVVLHLLPGRQSGIVELLSSRCPVPIREVEDKDSIDEGVIYFAPPNYHVLIEKNGMLALSIDPPVHYSRPSVDVLFESAADSFESRATGIVLSGANSDGAAGLQKIVKSGGRALVQNPKSAHSTEMPLAAVKACPEAYIVDIQQIGSFLRTGECSEF